MLNDRFWSRGSSYRHQQNVIHMATPHLATLGALISCAQQLQFPAIHHSEPIAPQPFRLCRRRPYLILPSSLCYPPASMPTPESPMFLAKKPKVPPTFDGVDYNDTARLKQAQDAIIREQWVQSMMARLIRDELGKCYYREGVNHLEKCGALRGMFGSTRPQSGLI